MPRNSMKRIFPGTQFIGRKHHRDRYLEQQQTENVEI
jgi:hypothetical protein